MSGSDDWCICLKVCVEFSIFVVICVIVGLSSNDPFNTHIIGNLTNYFNYPSNITLFFENISKYNNDTLYNSFNEDNKLQECINISPKTIECKDLSKRKLESKSFCTDMKESFIRNQGRKLSYIFYLNYTVIRRLSIAILVVTLSFIVFIVLRDLLEKNCVKKDNMINNYIVEKKNNNIDEKKNGNIDEKKNDTIDEKKHNKTDEMNQSSLQIVLDKKKDAIDGKNKKYKCILKVVKSLITLIWIAKFVLSLLLYHFIEIGDTQKYEDFLDCRGIKKEFFEKLKGIKKLRNCITAFAVLSIISESFEKIQDLYEILRD